MDNKSIDLSNNFSSFDFKMISQKPSRIKSVKSMDSLCSEMISNQSRRASQNKKREKESANSAERQKDRSPPTLLSKVMEEQRMEMQRNQLIAKNQNKTVTNLFTNFNSRMIEKD